MKETELSYSVCKSMLLPPQSSPEVTYILLPFCRITLTFKYTTANIDEATEVVTVLFPMTVTHPYYVIPGHCHLNVV